MKLSAPPFIDHLVQFLMAVSEFKSLLDIAITIIYEKP